LYKFCKDKKYTLSIAGCSIENHKKEIKFYKKLLPNDGWVFFRKKNIFDTYKLLDKFDIVVSCGTSMGVEAIGRKCKVAFFGKNLSIYDDWLYGWPQKIPKKGFFYTNLINDREIKRIMNNLIIIKQNDWKKIVLKESQRVMKYDYKNHILKKILKLD
jgi:surface carbohydrate biosynthesis protein